MKEYSYFFYGILLQHWSNPGKHKIVQNQVRTLNPRARCIFFTHLKSRLRERRWRLACLAPSWWINKCKLTEESALRYLTHITQSSQRERKFTLICGCTWALSLPAYGMRRAQNAALSLSAVRPARTVRVKVSSHRPTSATRWRS